MSRAYSEVEFVEEGNIAIVPSIWLSADGSSSYWSPYNKNTQNQNAAKKCEIPQENCEAFPIKEWAICGIYIFLIRI